MGSINQKDVISFVHQLPDETWQEPSPEDPLSLIDQVRSLKFGYQIVKYEKVTQVTLGCF